jgi:hypothetical protein
MKNSYSKIEKCRICNDNKLISIGKLGPLTLTGSYLNEINSKIELTPVDIVFSKKSFLVQLKHNYNQSKLFGNNYGYRSGLNRSMIEHLKNKSKKLTSVLKLKKNDYILDIGSNDGTFLNSFNKNLKKFGSDPTAKKYKKFYNKNISVVTDLFPNKKISKVKKKFKLISSIAMFYDLSNPIKFCFEVAKILDLKGIFHVEIAYLPDIINKNLYDTFCQEHLTYYSYLSFKFLIDQTPFKIIDYERNLINGGSINFNLAFKESKFITNYEKIKILENDEIKQGIHLLSTYKNFFKRIKKNAKQLNLIIRMLKKKNKKIYGFGASTKGNVILQVAKITNKLIEGIYDINAFKFNKYTPGSKIIIKNERKIYKDKPDYLILLIWHFSETIKEKIKKFNLQKMKCIMPFPSIKILSNK